jgi:hypothetical protein
MSDLQALPTGSGGHSSDDQVRLFPVPGVPTRVLEFTRAEWELLQSMRRSSDARGVLIGPSDAGTSPVRPRRRPGSSPDCSAPVSST